MIPTRCSKTRRRGQTSTSTIVMIAVAGIAAAGFFYFQRTRAMRMAAARQTTIQATAQAKAATPPKAAKPAAGRPVSTAPDLAEIRTPIVLLAAGKDGKAGPVVALGQPEGSRDDKRFAHTRQGLIDRELVRQALVLAARDELGVATLDELLDDASPARGDGAPIELALLFRAGECHALVRRGDGADAEILLAEDLGTQPGSGSFVPELAIRAEALSRIEFPALWKRLGLQGKPNAIRDDAPVPPEVDRRLETLGLVDHFAAVRLLHEAIRADGESPARLSALARAYAQLGVLTEYQWSAAHRAFKARAMLYAHRLLSRHPDSPFAVRTRAFVLAMVGRLDIASRILDRARGLADKEKAAGKAPEPTPSWLPVLEAYLKADRDRLADRDGPHPRLAALLAMIAVEFPRGTRVQVGTARAAVALDADCQRAYDAICAHGQLGDLHAATVLGPDAFTKLFPVKLKSLASLPAPLKAALDRGDDEMGMIAALDEAGRPEVDRGELSWGVLAHLAREARFVHAWRRLFFMANQWHVPTEEYFQDIRPFVARHRYFPYLESLGLLPQQGVPALKAMADRMNPADIEMTELTMLLALQTMKHPAFEPAWALAISHGSGLARDFCERIAYMKGSEAHLGRVLLTISPCSAFAMATLIGSDWDQVKGEVPAWRQKVGDAPALLGALGRKHLELRQYDEAEKELRRYMELSPDKWAYEKLADCYKARGDRARWKATLDEFLAKTESAGLQHAQVRVEIANDLMDRGRWSEAKPYAEAAAETWAAWAMTCAARCNEGLQDWAHAELWNQRTSERYPKSSWPQWYLFCKRTGHGDIEAARAFAQDFVAAASERPDLAKPHAVGLFYWASGSPKNAMAFLEKAEAARPTPLNAFSLILLADEQGDTARRDRAFEEFAIRFKKTYPRMVTLVDLLREAMAGGGRTSIDEAAVDRLLTRMPGNTRGNSAFLVGRSLLKRDPEIARKYLKEAIDSPQTNAWLGILATDSLKSIEAKRAR